MSGVSLVVTCEGVIAAGGVEGSVAAGWLMFADVLTVEIPCQSLHIGWYNGDI